MILAIETSCDETCAAVVDGTRVVSSVVASQAGLHDPYGGVVPEIASRQHLEVVGPVVRQSLADAGLRLEHCSAIAVTVGPGLIGALLVGVAAAKAYAYAGGLPLIPVDHLAGHVASVDLDEEPLAPPFLCLLVSGGHSLLLDVPAHGVFRLLGRSLDDAAGEAFDKGARLLGLGYPGGPEIERTARHGDTSRYPFTTPMRGREGLNLSFAGLKTALATRLRTIDASTIDRDRAHLCASYQEAIVSSVADRVDRALALTGRDRLAIVGGVAANGSLRSRLASLAVSRDVDVRLAPLRYCSDNAAMVGAAARHVPPLAFAQYSGIDAYARSPIATSAS